MRNSLSVLWTVAALASAGPATAQVNQLRQEPRVDDARCWSDWSEAAVIVRRETLTPVDRVTKLVRDKHPGGEIIKLTLCEERGKFVYRVVLREKQGQLKSELMDAK